MMNREKKDEQFNLPFCSLQEICKVTGMCVFVYVGKTEVKHLETLFLFYFF